MNYKNKITINTNDNEYKNFKINFNDYIETNDFIIIDKYLLGESIGREVCDVYKNDKCDWDDIRTKIELLTDEIASTIFYISEEFVKNNLEGEYNE